MNLLEVGMDTTNANVGYLIKRLSEALDRNANNLMRPLGVSISQMRVLTEIDESPKGYRSLKELEQKIGVSQPTIWGIAKRLEEKGLVEVVPDVSRSKLLKLTEAGHETRMEGMKIMDESEAILIRGLDDQEARTLSSLLARARDNLDAPERA